MTENPETAQPKQSVSAVSAAPAASAVSELLNLPELSDIARPMPVSDSKVLVDTGAPWQYRQETIIFDDGTTANRQFLQHPGAVQVVALDEQNRVLMIRQYRHAQGMRLWEFPAGLCDQQGEALAEVARRELFEETEYLAAEISPLGVFRPTPGSSSEVIHFFTARGITKSEQSFEREAEEAEIEVAWVPLGVLLDGVFAGKISSGPTQYGILMASLAIERGEL